MFSALRSSQLITEMARAASWVQSDKGACQLDRINLSQSEEVCEGASSFTTFCLLGACIPPAWHTGICRDICLPSNSGGLESPNFECHLPVCQLVHVHLGSWATCGKWQCPREWKAWGVMSQRTSQQLQVHRNGLRKAESLWTGSDKWERTRGPASKQILDLNEWIRGPQTFSAKWQIVDGDLSAQSLLQLFNSTAVAGKQPQTICKQKGRASFQ